MSSAFAIAAVTAVLKDLLNNKLVDHDLSAVGNVLVTALPPDRIPTSNADERSQINLFLYQVTPNIGWRNVGLPSRDANAVRLTNPPLALDLHYLITTYGAQEFHAEALLGYAMQLLHETPILTREMINETLKPALPPEVSLPPGIGMLSTSDLAEQVELIKICPQTLTTEEISKLWTATQAHYRPTAAYQISVVLIQSTFSTRAPLPVLRRGKDDRGPSVSADLIPPFPTLERISLPDNRVIAQLNDQMTLLGHHFALDMGDPTQVVVDVRFATTRLAQPISAPIPSIQRTDTQILVNLTGVFYPAGLCRVSANVMPNGQPLQTRTTNELPLMLAPAIVEINGTALPIPPALPISVARNGSGDATLLVQCSPDVLPEQSAALLIGDLMVNAEAHTAQTDTLTFVAKQLPAGTYRLRLRIDGVDSPLVDFSDPAQPKFDDSQRVTIT